MARACCDDMQQAFRHGMDAEGYGPLFYRYPLVTGEVRLSSSHPTPVRFCPWCGASVARAADDGASSIAGSVQMREAG